MSWAIRSSALAVGAAALLSTQAVYAAPVRTTPSVDPLVTLSLLGTTQSRAAVCAAGATCTLPMTMAAATQATSPSLAASAASVAVQDYPPPGKRVDPLLIGLGIAVILAIIIALASGNGDGDGNLTPVSPD